MYEKKDWKDSEFICKVRIKKEKSEFLKKYKGKKTIAGFLDEIINFYKKNGLDQISNPKKNNNHK
jgi:hypothetical protein